MMIFPIRVEVVTHPEGTALRFIDHPTRQPIETAVLDRQQGRKLLEDLVRELYPMAADDILAHLP